MKELITFLGKDGLKSAYTLLSDFALYAFIALAVVLAIAYFIVKYRFAEKLAGFKTLALGISVGFAVTLSLLIGFLMIARLYVKEELDANYYLVLGFFVLLFAYAVCCAILSFTSKKYFKIVAISGLILCFIYIVILLFLLPTVGEEYSPLNATSMYLFSFLLITCEIVLIVIFDKNNEFVFTTKSIAFAGVSIAIAFALSYVKLFSLPQGGSITLASMFPILLYAYVFGAKKGVLVGVIYGILQFIQSPQIYQPMQVVLDYPLAFGSLGLAGIVGGVKKIDSDVIKFIIGAVIGCILRYVCHFLSGYYVFSSWAMEGYTALTWSLVYNLFVIVELAIVIFVSAFLLSSKSFVKEIQKFNNK
ncbi:MAG: energy-coupled thiamine transporter ThiT [Clostridia bacterium]|nr:energy-coupled thiamine transporter ThiT [Clostridia bacterium]